MAGLEKFVKSTSLSTPSSQPPASANLQQESGEYSGGTIKVWNDFALLRTIGTNETVSLVEEPTTIRRQKTLYFQKRFAWASFKDAIHAVVLLRPLKRSEDNKLKPNGEWFIETHDSYKPTSAPKVRKGALKNSYASKGSNSSQETDSGPARPLTDAEYAVSLLPTELQTHIAHLTSKGKTTLSAGSSGRSDNQGRLTEENVRLLLLSEGSALVLHATRNNLLSGKDTPETSALLMNSQDWNVTQYTYPIAPIRNAVEAKKRQGIES